MTYPAIQSRQSQLQRVAAEGRIAVKLRDGATRIDRLFQEGAAKLRMPAGNGTPLEAVLINTAGGLTGGDRVSWTIDAGDGTSLVATTQACEKVYRSSGGRAEVDCTIRIGAGAHVAWLPQETIVFDRSAFRRRLDIELAEGATCLVLEATIFGRRSMGEAVGLAEFRDRWRVRRAGRLVHAEEFSMGPDIAADLSRAAVAKEGSAVATLLLVCDEPEAWLAPARTILGESGGVSAWRVGGTGKLLARLLADDGYALRRRLAPLVGLLNGQAGLPKIWSL